MTERRPSHSGLAMSTGSHSLYALSFYAVSQALLPHSPTLLEHLQMVPLVLFTTIVPLPFGRSDWASKSAMIYSG